MPNDDQPAQHRPTSSSEGGEPSNLAAEVDPAVIATAVSHWPDAVVILDSGGVVRYWNRGAERIFGYRAHEMIGSLLESIIPERLRERHAKGFSEAVARGSSHYGENDLLSVPATTAQGATISIEFAVSLLKGEDERVRYVAAVIRDVTERWSRERDMRRRLEALERAAGEGSQPATP